MEVIDLLKSLQNAKGMQEFEKSLEEFLGEHGKSIEWVPVGKRENNVGTIEGSSDPGRSIIERVTNGIDAILELEYEIHNGFPECRSPREAAQSWLNVPARGLSELSQSQRRDLAHLVTIRIQSGDGKESRIIEIRDEGVGLTPEQMPVTILSLNESNKLQKYYVAGMYGQGGSSTFARSKYTFICSRYHKSPKIGFTLVKYLDLPPESYKSGHYVYLTYKGSVFQTELALEEFNRGTQVKHYGYDISGYSNPLGPKSLYGLMNSILFDPILPIWLDNEVHNYRRVIKGSRNALNGAIDDDDDSRRGPDLSHSMKMFFVDLGDWGRIGIEYWVLKKPEKDNRNPTSAFVNPNKPIILTLNGQSHAEFPKSLINKNAELPYLAQRFIGHIDCNSLSPAGKRALFVSNREDARSGLLSDLIQDELIKAIKSDDELVRLNLEARSENIYERDKSAIEQMRKEVANILKVPGLNPTQAKGALTEGGKIRDESTISTMKPHLYKFLRVIEVKEPPTYIKFIWNDEEIPFYPGQRRYVRIESDANSTYHNPDDPKKSRINVIDSSQIIKNCGSTALNAGRMRIIYECNQSAKIGSKGEISVELVRQGLPVLRDTKKVIVVEEPPLTKTKNPLSLPPFQINPIQPGDDAWEMLEWPDDPKAVASAAISDAGNLDIYYSMIFPPYVEKRNSFDRRDPALAKSFTQRYEVWLAAHSLLLLNDQNAKECTGVRENPSNANGLDTNEQNERKERCRIATISAIFAEREILSLDSKVNSE